MMEMNQVPISEFAGKEKHIAPIRDIDDGILTVFQAYVDGIRIGYKYAKQREPKKEDA